jgi:peptide/nickel transport system permease protein
MVPGTGTLIGSKDSVMTPVLTRHRRPAGLQKQFLSFLLRRSLESVALLAGVVTLVFFLSRLLPGDPTQIFLSPNIPQSVSDHLREQFGLNKTLPEQYLAWLSSLLQGDLGHSFSQNSPVAAVLKRVLPNTLLLGGAAFFLEVLIALALVVGALARPHSPVDRLLSGGTLIAYTLPTFWVGFVLLWIFAYSLGLLPASQMASSNADQLRGFAFICDRASHLLLPALTIALPGGAGLARYMRAGITSALRSEFVLAARSLGLGQHVVTWRYILPNVLATGISYLGVEFGLLLAGVVVTETLFAWPGMGRLVVTATFARDYPLLLGTTCFAGCMVILGNLIADVLNAAIDPRIRTLH